MAISNVPWFATTVEGPFGVGAGGIFATIVRVVQAFVCVWVIISVNINLVNDIWNKSYMNCRNEMKRMIVAVNVIYAKKLRTSTGFEPVTSRLPVRCSTNWAMNLLTLGVGQLWVHMFPWKKWVLMIHEINHIWTAEMKWKWRNDRRGERNLCNCVKKPEVSVVHMNIWTYNWPAPNVSGFIAQLIEHRSGNGEVKGSNPVEVLIFLSFFTLLVELRILRRSFLRFQILTLFWTNR